MLQECQSRIPNAECLLVPSTGTRLPVPDSSKQLLLCIEVAPVINSTWFADEVNRVLVAGGLIMGVNWNAQSFRGWLARYRSRKDNRYYVNAYAAWRQRLSDLGFHFLREEGCCWGPFSRESNSWLIPLAVWLEKVSGLRRLIRFSPWVVFVARKHG
jgi:hypothetical protein